MSTDAVELRPIDPTDTAVLAAVLALNERWVPHVGSLTMDALVALLAQSDHALAAVGVDGSLDGFLILVAPGATYASPNYRFFQSRLDAGDAAGPFRYVDRIAVDPSTQGRGVGRALISALQSRAQGAGHSVVRWITAADNVTAQRLYDDLATRTQWVTYDAAVAAPSPAGDASQR